MTISKPLKIAGGVVLIIIGLAVYMFLNKITPRDYTRLPVGVLDDAIVAAKENDLEGFKRTFTKEMRDRIQRMHDSNMNRELGSTSPDEQSNLFWTWNTLMDRMARQGGFEVKSSSTGFLDYMIDGKAKLDIVYVDSNTKQEKQKNYTLIRNQLIWRIDLSQDPDFAKAYNQSVTSFKTTRTDNMD